MSKNSIPTELPLERALLIGVAFRQFPESLSLDDSLSELALLAQTAGLDVVGEIRQNLDKPNPKTYLGSGKVEEVRELITELVVDVLLFDDELNPRHQRELERVYGDSVRIIDRTALILDIFAQHAATREGAMQVELAQYEYRLPRLTRAWTHLARQAGGGGGRAGSVGGVGLRGPGETQLEVDRRDIRRRIAHIRNELEKVRQHRGKYRARRKEASIPTVAIVGYTNAGKSTLLNTLSRADVYVADELFATLDPTTRRVNLPSGRTILMTDTVGFIQKLPTTLVAAFRATLEEIRDADILLHVVDITHMSAQHQAESVLRTLEEIDADHIPMVTALNKIDQLQPSFDLQDVVDLYDRAVPISAAKGTGSALLLSVLEKELFSELESVTVTLPYKHGRLISIFHDQGRIEGTTYEDENVILTGQIPRHLLHEFEPYRTH